MLDGAPPLHAHDGAMGDRGRNARDARVRRVPGSARASARSCRCSDCGRSATRSRPLEAVPFARVMRDGGFTVQFFVNQQAPLAEYLADWTATHEFSHLLLPYVQRSDAWVSEGFASYYQNVLMARAGVLDERARGRSCSTASIVDVASATTTRSIESIRRRGPNMLMRMYWSGAAVALMADVELRGVPATAIASMRCSPSSHDCCLDRRTCVVGARVCSQRFDDLMPPGIIGRCSFRCTNRRHIRPSFRTSSVLLPSSAFAGETAEWSLRRDGAACRDPARDHGAATLSTRLPPIRPRAQDRARDNARDPRPSSSPFDNDALLHFGERIAVRDAADRTQRAAAVVAGRDEERARQRLYSAFHLSRRFDRRSPSTRPTCSRNSRVCR